MTPRYAVNQIIAWGRQTTEFKSGTMRITGIRMPRGRGILYDGIGIGGEDVFGVKENEIIGVGM